MKTDNFGNLPSDSALPEIGLYDSGHSSALRSEGGGPFEGKDVPQFGAFKKTKTDMSGPSSEVKGYGFMSPTIKDVGQAPGNGDGSITDNMGQGNSSGIAAAQPIEPMVFGDPNDTGLDFKDGRDANTVTIRGGETGDISSHDITKPNPMGG